MNRFSTPCFNCRGEYTIINYLKPAGTLASEWCSFWLYRDYCHCIADSIADSDKHIWLEVYDVPAQKWLTIDYKGDVIDDISVIENSLRKPVTYIVSFDNGKFDMLKLSNTYAFRLSELPTPAYWHK